MEASNSLLIVKFKVSIYIYIVVDLNDSYLYIVSYYCCAYKQDEDERINKENEVEEEEEANVPHR